MPPARCSRRRTRTRSRPSSARIPTSCSCRPGGSGAIRSAARRRRKARCSTSRRRATAPMGFSSLSSSARRLRPTRPLKDDARTMTAPSAEKVLILDFGSQVTQLIARRLRESGVYCEIHPFAITAEKLAAFAPKAVILSGGPASVHEHASPRAPQKVFELGVPVLGICYGQQTMCAQLGGRVAASDHREFGRAFIDVIEECALFAGLWPKGSREQVWMSHGDRVEALPEGFRAVAVSEGAPFAVVADDRRRFYGTMFHPEVIHTPQGAALLRNFT